MRRNTRNRIVVGLALLITGCLLGTIAAFVAQSIDTKAKLQRQLVQKNVEVAAQEQESNREISALIGEVNALHLEVDRLLVATTDQQRQQAINDAANAFVPVPSAPTTITATTNSTKNHSQNQTTPSSTVSKPPQGSTAGSPSQQPTTSLPTTTTTSPCILNLLSRCLGTAPQIPLVHR